MSEHYLPTPEYVLDLEEQVVSLIAEAKAWRSLAEDALSSSDFNYQFWNHGFGDNFQGDEIFFEALTVYKQLAGDSALRFMSDPPKPHPIWHPAEERPEAGRVVWIIERHPKEIYPQSYTIHAGQVEDSVDNGWRVSQGDENGCGWCSWYPDIEGPHHDELYIAWSYVEDFTTIANFLKQNKNII